MSAVIHLGEIPHGMTVLEFLKRNYHDVLVDLKPGTRFTFTRPKEKK